ncbi:MAG: hypothetical protein IPF98_03220 [Gemmatimonadetes bacterium]|nr:hypothetical protein [Gemmatimonadota bacterium]
MPSFAPQLRRAASRAVVVATILLVVVFACTARGASQGAAPPPAGPVMLKRIAEAVDGNRTGDLVYVVASFEPTSPVLGVFPDVATARAVADKSGVKAAVFGPYQTDLDNTDAVISACVHDRFSSRMQPERCTPPVNRRDIVQMELVLQRSGGGRDTIPLSPDADAIFLGMAAIDKFVVPYYVRTIGLRDAGQLRDDFEQRFRAGARPQP